MTDVIYPQDPSAWRLAIRDGIGLTEAEGRASHRAGTFPYDRLGLWMREAFREGFSPDFVPALLRNIQGLAAWAYGEGSEPCWPESDSEDRGQV